MKRIRDVFAQENDIDRRIEKVIDYAAVEETRLDREIREYRVTPSIERGMERFLDAYATGAEGGEVVDVGVWVSGFYGSGKSSLTKYLAFALDPNRKIGGKPFRERLAERIDSRAVQQRLLTVANKYPAAVFMLDLGTDQLADSANEPVSNVLYWNVLKQLGFSKDKKVARLELRLDADGRLHEFRQAYADRYRGKESWDEIKNDPQAAVLRAAMLAPQFYPDDYPGPDAFRYLRFEDTETVEERTRRMLDLIQRKTGQKNALFFIDEVGQYVASQVSLMLNLDGFVRVLKELGRGHAWVIATAQQTLAEIKERAVFNSADLFKLKDRFPLAIELEASDIRTITQKRLLEKSNKGAKAIGQLFAQHGELLRLHTRTEGFPDGADVLDGETVAGLYPFLPARFELVLDLIRFLARRTGGTGLRSAIRVVQDILVDASRMLPKGAEPLAERPLGRFVAVDDVYDTLKPDLRADFGYAVEGVERIAKHRDFKDDWLAIRVAKAVAALQPLENRPRTAENIAALLYHEFGVPGFSDEVRKTLHRLVDAKAFGLVELRADTDQGGSGGFVFLSDEVQPLQKKREEHKPTSSDLSRVRTEVLRAIFVDPPTVRVEQIKPVKARVLLERMPLSGEDGDVPFSLEEVEPGTREARVAALEAESQIRDDYKNTAFWVFERPTDAFEHLVDACKSSFIEHAESGRSKDGGRISTRDVEIARFIRSERRRAERAKDAVRSSYTEVLRQGILVFRGRKRPVAELGTTVSSSGMAFLDSVAADVFSQFRLVKKIIAADVAQKFLEASDRLDRLEQNKDRDPLGLVQKKGGRHSIHTGHPALQEVRRAFRALVDQSGSGRVQGGALLEFFLAPPYGFTKDTTRYLFAALLLAGEVEFHGGDGVVRTSGPRAIEAVRNTQNFSRLGISPRGEPVPMEALDRASRRLEALFNEDVLPLEDQISRSVRAHFPTFMEEAGSLPDRLRLLGLPGENRAREVLQAAADLLKEDAGGAASLLGSVQCKIPEDVQWARAVTKMLKDGGEAEVQSARSLLAKIRETCELFPDIRTLGDHPSVTALEEVLGRDSFHDKLPELRQAARVLRDAVLATYTAERLALRESIAQVWERLSARAGFLRLRNEEYALIKEALSTENLPEAPFDSATLLGRLLLRRLELPRLEEQWIGRIDATTPQVAPRVPFGRQIADETTTNGTTPPVEDVRADEIFPETTILANVEDVRAYVGTVEARLLERIQLGAIRIVR